MDTNTHTIDASGKKLGRVASEASSILMGKNLTTFARNKYHFIKVHIQNVSKADISEKKRVEKTYDRYTGYPGGRRVETAEKVIATKGYTELFRKAIYGMLPSNKLRSRIMKNLIISE